MRGGLNKTRIVFSTEISLLLEEVPAWVFGPSVFVSILVTISKKYFPQELK
jgi:hypothetical protein